MGIATAFLAGGAFGGSEAGLKAMVLQSVGEQSHKTNVKTDFFKGTLNGLLAMASNLLAMASNPIVMASTLLAMASNLIAMASTLLAVV